MSKLKVWFLIMAVFVAGFATGAVVTRAGVRHFISRAVQNPNRVREFVERRLDARLRLNSEQKQKAHEILMHSQGELRDLREEFAPRFVQILSNSETEINAILTPEQRERFEQFRRENREFLLPR